MEALLETKIFKVSVERLLLNGGQTLYMVGIALLIGTVIGTLLALVLVLCRKGGDLVREFTFTNDGTAPLVVTRVITSCSCLKASFPKRPVPPGGQGVIRITYEPHKSEPGVFNKVIQVYSNSVDGRDVITVQGNSIDTPPRKIKTDKVKVKYK